MFIELSESELEVMEVLWNRETPASFGELLKHFEVETSKGWKKQTLNTFLYRMQEKQVLTITIVRGRKRYAPALTREEYTQAEGRAYLNKKYQGSLSRFIVALGGGNKLKKNEADELRQILKEWDGE